MKKTEKMIHQNIRFRSRIDTFLVSIEEFPSPNMCTPHITIYVLDKHHILIIGKDEHPSHPEQLRRYRRDERLLEDTWICPRVIILFPGKWTVTFCDI